VRNGRTAFVLAGGGSLGAVQVGMLRALLEAGITPDAIFGASVGALNGAFTAFHPDLRGNRDLRSLWLAVGRKSVFPTSIVSTIQGLRGRRNGMVSSVGLERILDQTFGHRRLEDGDLPCHVVTADAETGERVVLSRGSVVEALLASTAVPGVFSPVAIEGRSLFDGGVASNTPIRTAVDLGFEEVMVLPTGCQTGMLPSGPLAISLHALNLLIAHQLVEDVEALHSSATLRVVPPICPSLVSPYDFSRSEELVREGYQRTRAWVGSGGLERQEIPPGLLPPQQRVGGPMVRGRTRTEPPPDPPRRAP